MLNLSGADNRSARLYHCDASDNSKWIFVGKGDGWYEIFSANKRNDCLTDNGLGNQNAVEPCTGRARRAALGHLPLLTRHPATANPRPTARRRAGIRCTRRPAAPGRVGGPAVHGSGGSGQA